MSGIHFNNWRQFSSYFADQIKADKFLELFRVGGFSKEDVLSLWQQVDIFDWDNLELGEWEGFSLMFPDDEIYKMVQQQFPLIELFTCRLLPNGKSLAFYLAGDSNNGTEAFDCYSYGFIEDENTDNHCFVCLVV